MGTFLLMPAQADSTSRPTAASHTWLKDLLILGMIALVWFGAFFGMRPLTNPDEGRYTEIPREMALSGDFVTPRLNGMKYFEKPPLLYWLSAMTFKVAGISEFSARLWNGLFAVAGILITYWAARSLYGRAAGIWAALVLGTSLLYYALGQILTLDMAVAVTMSGAMFSFLLGVREPKERKRFLLLMACYVCMALATLTKGLIGFVLPGAVMFLWTLLMNRWRPLLPLYLIPGGLLFLAIAAPWHVLAAMANHDAVKEHDFLWFYFVHEHFLRFTTTIHGRVEPSWFFIPCLLVGLFPWVFFSWETLKQSLKGGWKARQENSEAWFLVIWIAFIMLFFSKSQSKLIPYIVPVFPAAAVLIGRTLSKMWADRSSEATRKTLIGFAIFTGCLAIGLIFVRPPKKHPEFAVYLPLLKTAITSTLVASVAVLAAGLRMRRMRMQLCAVAGAGFALLVGANLVGGVFDSGSTKTLAMALKPKIRAEDDVYCLALYAQDLPVYLNRLVKVVAYRGELEFGIEAEPDKSAESFISKAQFMEEWAKPGTRYAVLRKADMKAWFPEGPPPEILAEKGRYIAVAKTAPAILTTSE